jgi:hypothetical protein
MYSAFNGSRASASSWLFLIARALSLAVVGRWPALGLADTGILSSRVRFFFFFGWGLYVGRVCQNARKG